MGRSKVRPVGEWGSVKDAVAALHAQKLTPVEITRQLGVSENSVRSALRNMGVTRMTWRGLPEAAAMRIPPGLSAALKDHARRRNRPVHVLAWQILDRVVQDRLVDAVLDDGGAE